MTTTNQDTILKLTEFWDNRYSTHEFVYGKEPNNFFKEQIDKLTKGKILLPAEGEGRNAIYAAKQGWEVTAIDQSQVAKEKAMSFAREEGVDINYNTGMLEEYSYQKNYFDAVALIYAHFELYPRKKIHFGVLQSLKPGGYIFLEAFHKNQAKLDTGGPDREEILYNLRDLFTDFPNLKLELAKKMKTNLNEGNQHNGQVEIVRLVGIKME